MKFKIRTALSILILVICTSILGTSQVRPEQIDAIFQPLVTDNSPGYAVGVISNGKLIFSRGYGLANLETKAPITPHTDFRLASVTKQFTATAIMLLVHDGKLRYDEPITEVFPEFPAYGKQITIRNLLNHTSGLKDYEDVYAAETTKLPPDKIPQLRDKDVLRIEEQQTSTLFPPGSKWQYSNSGYSLLAMTVERASGESFENFLHDRIFKPLGMNHTVAYVNGENEVPNRAFGYRNDHPDHQWYFADQSPTSAVLGDGGIYTSIDDLVKWDRALADHTLLSTSEMQPAFTPVNAPGVVKPDNSPTAYGFGWFLDPYKGHRRMWHYGETIGFLTAIQRLPDDHLTVIVLSNRVDVEPRKLAEKILDLYLAGEGTQKGK